MSDRRIRILLVPTLVACAPFASAATAMMVPDDDVRLNIGLQVQTRVEDSRATGLNGAPWDTVVDRSGQPADLNWSIPRARLTVGGSYGTDYHFGATLAANQVDTTGYQTNQGVQLYRAWAERDFFDGSAQQTLHIGLDFPFFNRVESASRYSLFPTERASEALMTVRGVGARYLFSTPDSDLGVDVMESLDPGKPAANAGRRDGMFYSARLEFSPLDGPKPTYQESWAGAPGQGILLGADVGYDHRDLGTAGFQTERLGWGVEGLGHLDAISALIEVRFLQVKGTPFVGGVDQDLHQRVYILQAGWAFPLADLILEPAIRYSVIDLDTQAGDAPVTYDGGPRNPGLDSEWGDSGRQFDLGINAYFHGHGNKLQLSFSRWSARGGEGQANIWRLQHQLSF